MKMPGRKKELTRVTVMVEEKETVVVRVVVVVKSIDGNEEAEEE